MTRTPLCAALGLLTVGALSLTGCIVGPSDAPMPAPSQVLDADEAAQGQCTEPETWEPLWRLTSVNPGQTLGGWQAFEFTLPKNTVAVRIKGEAGPHAVAAWAFEIHATQGNPLWEFASPTGLTGGGGNAHMPQDVVVATPTDGGHVFNQFGEGVIAYTDIWLDAGVCSGR